MSEEPRRVTFSWWVWANLLIWAISFSMALSGIRAGLNRIADAIERAHPATEASK